LCARFDRNFASAVRIEKALSCLGRDSRRVAANSLTLFPASTLHTWPEIEAGRIVRSISCACKVEYTAASKQRLASIGYFSPGCWFRSVKAGNLDQKNVDGPSLSAVGAGDSRRHPDGESGARLGAVSGAGGENVSFAEPDAASWKAGCIWRDGGILPVRPEAPARIEAETGGILPGVCSPGKQRDYGSRSGLQPAARQLPWTRPALTTKIPGSPSWRRNWRQPSGII